MISVKLTVIITFLNEGDEIQKTVDNIRATVENEVEIILIDDSSSDKYDYRSVAHKYGTQYFYNDTRLGVAASRDKGVALCKTPYFLLLDGHMRFYKKYWNREIINILENDDRVLLCCQSRVLEKNEVGETVEAKSDSKAYGSYIDLDSLQPLWISDESVCPKDETVLNIPCVLGAAYSASTRYWKYLNGLKGLLSYGGDEAYISLKVWLEGGQCMLLNDIITGHLYRESAPYEMPPVDFIHNNLFISELLLPISFRKFFNIRCFNNYGESYKDAVDLLIKEKHLMLNIFTYYQTILSGSRSQIWSKNPFLIKKFCLENENELKSIAYQIVIGQKCENDNGLFKGKMGQAIFLGLYAKVCNISLYDDFAYDIIKSIISTTFERDGYGFSHGISGIAWGVLYLQQMGIMEKDEDLLNDFDNFIMRINPLFFDDWSFDFGLAGIIFYVLNRILSGALTFRKDFLNELYLSAKKQICLVDSLQGCLMAQSFINYIDGENIRWNFYSDIYEFACPPFDNCANQHLGLQYGLAGKGLFYLRINNLI